jgi:hypothetical protein
MQLLDRYLQAVGNNLPQKKRDDILRELRANILEGVEDREAELGRPLTLEEEEAVLKQHGNPVVVGMRYWPKQYLIGPSLFPYYVYALKTVIPLAIVIACVVKLLELTAKSIALETVLGVLARVPWVIFMSAAWITIVFAVLDFMKPYIPNCTVPFEDWKPRNLPPMNPQRGYNMPKSVFEVIVSAIGLAWLLSIPFAPYLMLGPAASQMKYFRLAPEWLTFYWIFAAILFVQWLSEAICLAEPRMRSVRPFIGMAGRAATAALAAWMVKVPTFIWLSDLGRDSGKDSAIPQSLNMALHMAFRVMIVITLVQLVWEIVKMFTRRSYSGLASGSTQSAL